MVSSKGHIARVSDQAGVQKRIASDFAVVGSQPHAVSRRPLNFDCGGGPDRVADVADVDGRRAFVPLAQSVGVGGP
jgi:hypothetical protein